MQIYVTNTYTIWQYYTEFYKCVKAIIHVTKCRNTKLSKNEKVIILNNKLIKIFFIICSNLFKEMINRGHNETTVVHNRNM